MTKNAIKDALKDRLGAEIAGDFRVLKEHELVKFNDEANFVFEGESEIVREFYIFADTGTGDLWLACLDDGKVAFYDHDAGYLCASNLVKFNLDMAGWLEVAEMFGKFETINEPNDEQKSKFKLAVNTMCPQILEIWSI
ncbi:hypothetical protein [uncultured Campylobacter sp.]|uniref:hypothetical protein n=1 Tax=uncultured Campylobacter sp. TaxID=218934 RepID=UPI00260474C1|nr:hypothetical protein [uncultured Campylobacter sp.]